jgi:hypothetical protein
MRLVLYLAIACAPTFSVADPIAACRAAYADDLKGYAGCLEAELRALGAAAGGDAAEAGPDAERKPDEVSVPDGLGAEQVRSARQESSDDGVFVVIVDAAYDRSGLGTFRMEDGQVWRETTRSPRRHHLDPEERYEARIERGKLSGYRLYVDGVRWMKTVKRLE